MVASKLSLISYEAFLLDGFFPAPAMMNELVESLSANEKLRMENGKVDL